MFFGYVKEKNYGNGKLNKSRKSKKENNSG